MLNQNRCLASILSTRIWLLLAILSYTPVQAYDMTAVDVSNTTFYKHLISQGELVTDTLHQPLHSFEQRDTPNNSTDSIPTQTGLPSPFDTSLGNNFTDPSCPAFFTSFLNNATFQSCLPVSLLLQNSLSFFKTIQSPSALQHTLDTSCAASLSTCSPLMTSLVKQLTSTSNCGADYKQQNPLVLQAYSGLIAYEPLYKATCLKASTGDYCFSDAMTNNSDSSDSYPYYTAIGISLPTSAQPTCSTCLKSTMEVFAQYAVQKAQPLSQTYLACAGQVNQVCGSTFASTALQSTSSSTNGAVESKSAAGRLVLLVSLAVGFSFIY